MIAVFLLVLFVGVPAAVLFGLGADSRQDRRSYPGLPDCSD
jgi:hypothetical protein